MRRAFIVSLKQYRGHLEPASHSTAKTTLHRAAQRHVKPPLCSQNRAWHPHAMALGTEDGATSLVCLYQQQQGAVLAASQGGPRGTQA